MKILLMVHALTGGGAERVAACWANGLADRGHQVAVLTNLNLKQTYKTSPAVQLLHKETYNLKSGSIIERLKAAILNPLKALNQLRRLLRQERPDAVVNVLYQNQYMLLLARILAGVNCPIIMTDHNAYERPAGHEFGWKQWKNKFIDNRLFDRVTVLTERDKDILLGKGIKNVDVLYNPLFLTPADSIPQKEKILLACGRIDAWQVKGFDLLMKAWSIAGPAHPDWKLRVVGSGRPETIGRLKELASEGSSNLEFADYTADIVSEYRQASIFVLSSRYEGWGLVMVEAMSQGCAPVACDFFGRQREAVRDGENGLICEPDNVQMLAEKISLLMDDDNLRKRIQHQAPESVKKYIQETTALKLEQIINSAHRK